MKKISPLFMSGLIALCFSFSAFAQPPLQDLNQLELMKQFIGTWKTEIGEDSVLIWEVVLFGKAFEEIGYWQANGETYNTLKGLWGYSKTHKCIVHDFMFPGGKIIRDFGEFVSEKKMVGERYSDEKLGHANNSWEIHIISPDKFKGISKNRGAKYSWDDAKVTEYTYIRVK